jgi:hypothetical protein
MWQWLPFGYMPPVFSSAMPLPLPSRQENTMVVKSGDNIRVEASENSKQKQEYLT